MQIRVVNKNTTIKVVRGCGFIKGYGNSRAWQLKVLAYRALLEYLNPINVKVEEYDDGTFVARISEQNASIVPPKRGQGVPRLPVECHHRDDKEFCTWGYTTVGNTSVATVDVEKKAQRVEESVLRARRQVRAYVRNAGLTRLLTFTNGDIDGGFQSAEEAYDTFALWWRVHGQHLLPAGGVVVVAEQGGKNGRWHLHALCRKEGWLSYNRVRATWSRLLENKGYHSGTGIHRFHAGDESGRAVHGFKSTRVAAAYASKYLGKGMRSGRRRFRSYQCRRPATIRLRLATLDSALTTLYSRYGRRVHHMQWVRSPDGFPRALVVDGDILRR